MWIMEEVVVSFCINTSELRCCCSVCHCRENEECSRQCFLSTKDIVVYKKRALNRDIGCCDPVVGIPQSVLLLSFVVCRVSLGVLVVLARKYDLTNVSVQARRACNEFGG